MAPVKTRLTGLFNLTPLSDKDSLEFIKSRLASAKAPENLFEATAVIDAFGEVIVWIDEVEKSFAGTKSSGELDAGTTANMFSHFLTWVQESNTSAIIMATANDISKLPPEFIRAGRFDATFFVDLPTIQERVEIIRIMNRKAP